MEQLSFSVPRRVLYFDLETVRSAQEVGGWDHIQDMGMACGVLFDSLEDRFLHYGEEEVHDLVHHLQKGDLIVGFNHIRFDYRVLAGYSDAGLGKLPNFDILVNLTQILGHRLKLDSLVRGTLGEGKTADGLQSLQWVKEGRLDLVRDYCQKDVEVTKNLFLYGVEHGEVRFERSGEIAKVNVDWSLPK